MFRKKWMDLGTGGGKLSMVEQAVFLLTFSSSTVKTRWWSQPALAPYSTQLSTWLTGDLLVFTPIIACRAKCLWPFHWPCFLLSWWLRLLWSHWLPVTVTQNLQSLEGMSSSAVLTPVKLRGCCQHPGSKGHCPTRDIQSSFAHFNRHL